MSSSKVLFFSCIMASLAIVISSCSNKERIDLGHGVIADRESEAMGGKLGIMYGDSLIAAHYYDRIEHPDSIDGIVFAYKSDDHFHFDSHGYAILDLKKKKFIYEEDAYFPIDTIIAIDRLHYKLYNEDGRYFTTLQLTDNGNGNFDAVFIPYFSNEILPVSDFISLGEKGFIKPMSDDKYMLEMYNQNPQAYKLLQRMFNMWGVEGTPSNDLNFARAMKYFIAKDYNSNEGKALNDLHVINEILGGGNTADMTFSMSIDRCLANVQLSWEYEKVIADCPLYETEYTAWHNMIGAIANYMDFLFVHTDWYQCKRMDDEETLMALFDDRRSQLKCERSILSGASNFRVSCDTIKTLADIDSIISMYHSDKAMQYYHPMWYELKPTIHEWISSREMIASFLFGNNAKHFIAFNRELIDKLYYLIKDLDHWELRPCFPE